MIEQPILERSRARAAKAYSEPHARLIAAAKGAQEFTRRSVYLPIDVELMAYLVDIASDTLQGIMAKGEVRREDITSASLVLKAGDDVRKRSSVEASHFDTLSDGIDSLVTALRVCQTGRAD